MARSMPSCDLVGALTRTSRFRTLVTILVATQVLDDLRAAGPWLVLAPPDDAFGHWPRARLEALFARSNIEQLVDLAELHVARGLPEREGEPLRSLLGEPIRIADGQVNEGRAHIVSRRRCRNGVLVVVDRVLLPSFAPAHSTVRLSVTPPGGVDALTNANRASYHLPTSLPGSSVPSTQSRCVS